MKRIVLPLVLAVALTGCGDDVTGSSGNEVKVAVYNGPGAVGIEVTALENMFEWMGYQVSVVNQNFVLGDGLSRYDIIVFPGGNPEVYGNEIGETGMEKIRNYVAAGGGYIGICGGAMFACEKAYWAGSPMSYETLGVFDGDADGPADAGTAGYWTMEEFDLVMTHPICQGLADSMWVLFNNNPFFLPDNSSYRVALFSESMQVGFAACDYGDGRVFVMGPMPQFEENSDRDGVDIFDELDDRESDWPFMQNGCNWILRTGE